MRLKRIYQLLIIGFFILMFGIFVLSYYNVELLKAFVFDAISTYGYFLLFVLVFVSDLFEQPVAPYFIGLIGVLVGLNFFLVLFLAVVGSLLASCVCFFFGKKYFSEIMEKGVGAKSYDKYHALLQKYDKLALLIFALGPVPWVTFCWIAGAFEIRTRDFIYYGLTARAVKIIFALYFLVFIKNLIF